MSEYFNQIFQLSNVNNLDRASFELTDVLFCSKIYVFDSTGCPEKCNMVFCSCKNILKCAKMKRTNIKKEGGGQFFLTLAIIF